MLMVLKRLIRILYIILYFESTIVDNHIRHKPLNSHRQKKNVLLKQAIQRVNDKRKSGWVGENRIKEAVCVQGRKPVTTVFKEEREDK